MKHANAMSHEEPESAPESRAKPTEKEETPSKLLTENGASAEIRRVDGAEVLAIRDPAGAILFEYDAASGTGTLRMPGSLRLEAQDGSIDLVAKEGVRCVAGGEVALSAGTCASVSVGDRGGEVSALHLDKKRAVLAGESLAMAAKEADISFQKVRYLGRVAHATMERAEVLAGELTTKADTLIEHTTNAFRYVKELHQLHAGRLRSLVKAGMRLEGGHVVMRAKEEVQIDGEHIHLG